MKRNKDFVSVAEVAKKLGVGYETVLRWIKDGRVPIFPKGSGKYLIPREWLEKKIEK